MKGAIFEMRSLDFWKKFDEIWKTTDLGIPKGKPNKEIWLDFAYETITSYKHASSNGIVWTKEEKELFQSLEVKEQRKMIVRKSELQCSLLPYVNVDYIAYEYSTRSKESGKESFTKAKELLNKYKDTEFNRLESTKSEDILYFLRIAYKSGNLEAGVYLAKLLFKKARLNEYKNASNDIKESVRITKELLQHNIPENSYQYYNLYKWFSDSQFLFGTELTSSSLGLNREEARDCYNYALEKVVWEAVDEEAQRWDIEKTIFAAELYLAAGIKYQSPLAFFLAAQNYAPSGLTSEALQYALIPYNACLRCSIALGNEEALDTLITNYENGIRMIRKNALIAKLLQSYKESRVLINGLDPFFDEKYKPEFIIDYGSYTFALDYGGTIVYPGISRLVAQGLIKDPRDSDSTLESIKEYYLKVWQIFVSQSEHIKFSGDIAVSSYQYLSTKIYSKLHYGYPSARAYVFPKEALDLKIDFTKGLEGYGEDPNEEEE